jgi:hypothetical protein
VKYSPKNGRFWDGELGFASAFCSLQMLAHSLHEIFHAILYVLNSGSPRRLGTSLPLDKARGWGEWPSGPREQSKDLWGSVSPRHTPDQAAEESLVPLPIPPQISIAPQGRLQCPCS